MFQNPEQFAQATKALFEFQLETFNTLTSKAVQGLEQVVQLNMDTAKSGLERNLETGREISQAPDPKAAMAAASARMQNLTNVADYNRQLNLILADIRNEFTRAADAHMAEAKSNLSALIYDVTTNVRPGSENAVEIVKTAIDNAFRGYEQVTKATRDAVAAFEEQLAKAAAAAQQQRAAQSEGQGETRH
ncbi:phasin family protein [Pseudoduganella flava]|uniref:Phasin family protein n=1 Tax=Pseudoduganella flava TaxID=871742 RepID=A0A562PKH7_9BURK|nr:phasin family protein [Pseudoduganella flava]QGZ42287.1 TIGR01841 family phasin [Pseudoduganella flava]TWI44833.1 phasin family protein [Pseudoduganella flava]